ncbi:MAG: NAD(P)/FAD-dependent oxidoreductase, partial [Deltaproteobacteria bacterium]
QGIAAGFNMAGRRVAYRGSLSRNVMRIYGLDIMTAGVVEPPAADDSYEVVAVTDKHRDIYHKLVFRDDRLVGMMLINGIEQGGVLLSLIRREVAIVEKKERLLEPGFQVGKLMPQYFK